MPVAILKLPKLTFYLCFGGGHMSSRFVSLLSLEISAGFRFSQLLATSPGKKIREMSRFACDVSLVLVENTGRVSELFSRDGY
jgi:hypothetical protein